MELDNNLLRRAANGDVTAFEKLIMTFEKQIYNIAYRMLGNTEDAKDISQEIIIKIYKNLKKCHDVRALKSWITTIATNTCIDLLRKRKRLSEVSLEFELDKEVSKEPSPEEELLYKEIRSDIGTALAKLPDGYRTLIVMRDIHGLSYNEIAVGTGNQLGTVKSRLSRARNALRLLLQEQKKETFV